MFFKILNERCRRQGVLRGQVLMDAPVRIRLHPCCHLLFHKETNGAVCKGYFIVNVRVGGSSPPAGV
jgi:hypothetical protein